MTENSLFLLDAYALIYRAYFALIRTPRRTSKGMDTSAVFGFCNTLTEILRKEDPSHIAACFDPRGETFRHTLFTEYKSNREKQPEPITIALPYVKRILEAYNIPVIERPGYEADDVIGTLSRRAEREEFLTYMMTPDKDYGQLVTDRVLMYRPSIRGEGFEIRGPQQICERYGISSPHQIIDLLALEGDKIDNIPGCPGVGEKTAQKLIADFGSVENLLANIDKLKGALKTKIETHAKDILLSKELATINTDVPLPDLEIESLRRPPADGDKLIEVYRELEFRSFINRLGGSSGGTAATQPSPTAQPVMGSLFDLPPEDNETGANTGPMVSYDANSEKFTRIATPIEVGRMVEQAAQKPRVGLAVYGSGDDAMTARLQGLAIAVDDHQAFYVALDNDSAARREVLSVMEPLFTSKALLISHDVKRDYLLLKNDGILISAPYYDTSVAHYLLEPEMKHTLAALAPSMLHYEVMESNSDARKPASKKGQVMTLTDATLTFCERAVLALRLYPHLKDALLKGQLTKLMEEVELPLIRVLAEMEWTGVRIDVAELQRLSVEYTARLRALEEKITALAGEPFNIGSPMKVGEILFDKLKIDDKAKKTKKGSYSTTEEILEKLRDKHPIVDLILQYRGLKKLLATYIDTLPTLINPRTGKVHTSYNQTVTATGRISSTNPNLQNIPIRTEDGREIRRAFIADPGDIFMSADYSQIELRLIADISADKDMVEAFLSGADIHQSTASKIYHEPLESVTPEQRRRAKTANFGIIYGISAFGLAERLRIPRSEAKMLIDGYFATYPHIRDYIDQSIAKAREQGYVSTIMGRKRMLPDINSHNSVVRGYAERNAVNAPIQGSAADIIKVAMVRIFRRMEDLHMRSRMIMQVHDELIFNVVPEELPELDKLVTTEMSNAYKGLVPLEVSSGQGLNWLEAH